MLRIPWCGMCLNYGSLIKQHLHIATWIHTSKFSNGPFSKPIGGVVQMDFRFCVCIYRAVTFTSGNIFENFFMILKVHVQGFPTHLVRASNSSWARIYGAPKLVTFRENSVFSRFGDVFQSLFSNSCKSCVTRCVIFSDHLETSCNQNISLVDAHTCLWYN